MALADGRRFEIFRDTFRDREIGTSGEIVTLEVRFRLRGIPAGSRLRRWLFERESILNTLLFAGFDGYVEKLWMVDPVSCEYAGLYRWVGRDAAEGYRRYIVRVLRPLSSGSVRSSVSDASTFDRTIAPIDELAELLS